MPSAKFHKNRAKLSGLCSICRECKSLEAARKYSEHRREIQAARAAKKKTLSPETVEKLRKQARRLALRRIKNDPSVRLKMNVARGINYMLARAKAGSKCSRTEQILGCSRQAFMKRMESMFLPGMNWENYGKTGWHVHHHIPVKAKFPSGDPVFDLASRPEDVRRCFCFLNLRPEWASHNLSISNKLPEDYKTVLEAIDNFAR